MSCNASNSTGTAGHAAPRYTISAVKVAPIKASYPGVRRECAELGVCQGLTPPCQLCANHTRDEADAYKVEPFLYWTAITLLTVFTVMVGAGVAGYLYQSFS